MPDAAWNDDVDREATLGFIREAPFSYGVWNRFKRLYKASQATPGADAEMVGALLARVDDSVVSLGNKDPRVTLESVRSAQSVLAYGDYLLVARGYDYTNSDSLTIFRQNPNDGMNPVRVTSLPLTERPNGRGGDVTGMALCGSFLCITVSGQTQFHLHIVDVSDPTHPRRRGKVTFEGPVVLPEATQSYPYLHLSIAEKKGSKFQGLRILDLTNPDSPRTVGELAVSGAGEELGNFGVANGVAALIMKPVGLSWRSLPRSGGLHLIDVSAPQRPATRGTIILPGVSCVAMRGLFAYTGIGANTTGKMGLQIIDLRDPGKPQKSGFLPLVGFISDIALSSDSRYAYLLTNYGTMHTVDVREDAAPRLVHTTEGLGGAQKLFLAGDDRAYITSNWAGVALLSVARPDQPQRIGAPPSAETVGYMKRRGRRFLRGLAKSAPARYAESATEMFLALPTGTTGIDPSRHWATIDVLFGGGNRFRQTKHGRGRYVPAGRPSRFALRTREERAPGAWDARPDLLARLLQSPGQLPAVYAFAARALRATGRPLPTIADAILEQWLAGDEPLLIALGVRLTVGRLLDGATPSPMLAADAFFKASASVRQKLSGERGSAWAGKRTWAEPFALRLAERTKPTDPAQIGLTRRQSDAATLLARYFSWALSVRPDALLPLVAPFLATGRDDLRALIASGAANVPPANLLLWLMQLGRAEPRARASTLAALARGMKGVALERVALRGFVFNSDAFVRESGWQMIAASATGGELLRALWTELLQSPEPTAALTSAMASADALGLLERAGIGSAELAEYLSERPFLVGLLSPEAFGTVASSAPPSVTLSLVAASPDEHWGKLRPVWLRQLREGVGLTAMWLAAEDALSDDASGRLETRLLGDREIAETLLDVRDERILGLRDPAFGSILGEWATRYADRLTQNSSLLYDAATHPLPEVRTPALTRVGELGMSMPFALRLMESALPPSVVVGRGFFEAEPTGGAREPDFALALCDSPADEVRAVGRAYITGRWATLPHERILLALFENPDPKMQAFVADLLATGETDDALAAVPLFDAEVLRATNRARVAKERIKTRQTAQPSLDVSTLLTVARGRTPRDAEWALGELARRVARGETIEGVVVEGITGI